MLPSLGESALAYRAGEGQWRYNGPMDDSKHAQDRDPVDDNSPRLKPEDQAKVDEFLHKGVNSVERKPFKPLRLLVLLLVVVTTLSVLSQLLAKWAGVY
jgi:hypothetical protein